MQFSKTCYSDCAVKGDLQDRCSAYFGQVTPESAGDRICHRIVLASVCNGLGRSYFKCSSAEGSCVGTDHEVNPNWRWRSFGTRLSVYIKNIDPVARLRGLVVQKPPSTVCQLVDFWCAEERLPGVPYWLRQGQRTPDRGIPFGDLELEGNLVEGPLEYVGYIRPFDLPACPLGVLGQLRGETLWCRSKALVSAENCLSVTTVGVCSLQFDHTVSSGSDCRSVKSGCGAR